MATDAETGIITLPVADRPLVSILIPTISQAELLKNCLKSLLRHIGADISYEVVILLNAATDEVKSFVRDRVRGATVLESRANLGVAGGNNRSRTAARGEFLVLLHDDTEIEEGWLESLLETLAANPAAGAVGSMQFFPDGTPQRAGSILWQNATTSTPWGPCGTPDPRILAEVRPVDYVGTCSTIVRVSVWDAIGGMDEVIYPAYFVDVDLCMSILRHGRTIFCDPRSRVIHHQGSSSNKSFRSFLNHRNRGYFTQKWTGQLATYEPAAPDDPTAFDRANTITARRHADLTNHWKQSKPAAVEPAIFDAAKQEADHFRKEIDLLTEYRKSLEGSQTRLKDQLEKSTADLKTAREKIQQLKQRCDTLKTRAEKKAKGPLEKLMAKIKGLATNRC